MPSFEDALIAILFNHNIQAVVIRPGLALRSRNEISVLQRYLTLMDIEEDIDEMRPEDYGPKLTRLIAKVRPELDSYLITDRSVEAIAGLDLGRCRRVFYNQEDFQELHLNILRGVLTRFKTPFFTALKDYSKQPTGVFHAMPISRGKSISRSHWIQDMGAFYGPNIFLAETSATSRRARQPAGAGRPDQEGAGKRRAGLWLETDVLCHQRHLDLQQDRGAGADQARGYRAGRSRLPQIAPLRHGAGGGQRGLPRQLSAG